MMLSSFCNFGYFACIFAVFYAYVTFMALYHLMNPLASLDESILNAKTNIQPYLKNGAKLKIFSYLNSKSRIGKINLHDLRQSNNLIIDGIERDFNNHVEDQIFKINITPKIDTYKTLWERIQSNNTGIYLHVICINEYININQVNNITDASLEDGNILHGSVRLLKHDKIPKNYNNRYLLTDLVDYGIDIGSILSSYGVNVPGVKERREINKGISQSNTIISYFKPEVAVKLVYDDQKYPMKFLPPEYRKIKKKKIINNNNNNNNYYYYFYVPYLHVDEMGLTSDKYIPLNNSVDSLPLTLTIGTMTSQRYLLMSTMQQTLHEQKAIGFEEKDVDDVRRLISDTSVTLLGVTIIASLLHLLFEFLAFRSDLQFWSNNKTIAGLSFRSVMIELVSQIIIFLYLIEQESSMLVIIPALMSIFIQIWKLRRAFIISSSSSIITSTTITSSSSTTTTTASTGGNNENNEDAIMKLAKATSEADALAFKWILSLLLPIALAFSTRSLLYEKHASWYSWLISSLTSFVYTFGFGFMMPQLFINYKLKSVSALPWNYFVYKAINTFIDDLFAFIIKMPTMHRLSVFRDDVIFVIYLYQRYIYKIDDNRPVEK